MKSWRLLLILLTTCCASLSAQDYTYSSLKTFLAGEGIETDDISVEKRSKNLMALRGGADFRILVHENKKLSKFLKNRCYAVLKDNRLYINCKKLRFHKLSFGHWYAPAMTVGENIYFSAVPLGTVAAQKQHGMEVTLPGPIGDAIASSGLVSKRVYYEIDSATGKVGLVDSKRMLELLNAYPAMQQQFKDENSEAAAVTGKYLSLLKEREK
jgi:hypothetical protein